MARQHGSARRHENSNRNRKPVSGPDDVSLEFSDRKPLRGGGINHSINRPKHASTVSCESGQSERHRGACYSCLRTGLSCYNFIVLLVGLGALGLGVWMMVKDLNAREVSVLVGVKFYEAGACLLIAGGGIVALLAICGCCGTLKEDRCVLGFYAVTLFVMFLAIIGTAVLSFVFKDYLNSRVKDHMRETVVKKYGINIRDTDSKLLTEAWDSMQREIGCCGSHGNINSSYSWALFKSSNWYKQTKHKVPLVPESCCRGSVDLCTGLKDFNGPPWRGPPVPFTQGDKPNPHLYTDGCYNKLLDRLSHHVLIIGIIAAAVPVFLLIGTVISFILCGMVKKEDLV